MEGADQERPTVDREGDDDERGVHIFHASGQARSAGRAAGLTRI
jgi:hypothetical protein